MRLLRTIAILASLVPVVGSQVRAATEPREALLVSPAWLATHLRDANLVLLHVGLRPEYDAAHIPGARYISTQDLSISDRSPGGLTLQMLPAEDLRQRLQAAGISTGSRIVVYFGGQNPYISPSARIMLTFDYAGLGDRASVLDGGLDAWTRAGHETTAEVPPAGAGTLAPLALRPLVVDAEYVLANLKTAGIAIVDARDGEYYAGTKTGGSPASPHKAGHIAGAKSVPFADTVDASHALKPAEALRKLFASAGIKPGDTIVAYCHIGQQATQVVLAARSLGVKALLYDGSFEDWSRKGYPVE